MWQLILYIGIIIYILICIIVYNIYSQTQLKTYVHNNTLNINNIKEYLNIIDTDLKNTNDEINRLNNNIEIDNNSIKKIDNQIDQINNNINDLHKLNAADILLIDKKIDNIIMDKTINWNYGDQLRSYNNFESWPTRLAIVSADDVFKPEEIMNQEALGLKITNFNSGSSAWIILGLQNNILYTRIKDNQGNISQWNKLTN